MCSLTPSRKKLGAGLYCDSEWGEGVTGKTHMAVQNHCFVLFRAQETSECKASSAPRDSRVRSQKPQAKAGKVRVLDA